MGQLNLPNSARIYEDLWHQLQAGNIEVFNSELTDALYSASESFV